MSEGPPVAVVTGASRGAGRGIAIALGRHGATVYVTGRSEKPGDSTESGTIHETAAAVSAAGGKGIAVRVDHGDDAQVKELFDRIERDESRLDILVNNACALHQGQRGAFGFWEKPLEVANMLDVGLRSSYVATYYAAPLMVKRGGRLVVFTSASGAVHYVFGPAYGGVKAGLDKFAADMAVDFREYGVASVSIWMGPLRTERMLRRIEAEPEQFPDGGAKLETTEFTGEIIWALYEDPERMELSGQTVIGAELALRYGITDEGGKQPPSYREMFGVAPHQQYPAPVIR
jgi:NAD(P)-dependent dehydrogenase (short-subunit alcohol dehydrogenase family)